MRLPFIVEQVPEVPPCMAWSRCGQPGQDNLIGGGTLHEAYRIEIMTSGLGLSEKGSGKGKGKGCKGSGKLDLEEKGNDKGKDLQGNLEESVEDLASCSAARLEDNEQEQASPGRPEDN